MLYEIMTKQGHEEETGKAKITFGYNLPAKYILHTVGPVIQWAVTKEDKELLASCYRECLKIASETVKQFINKDNRIKKVVFNVFKDEDFEIYSGLL